MRAPPLPSGAIQSHSLEFMVFYCGSLPLSSPTPHSCTLKRSLLQRLCATVRRSPCCTGLIYRTQGLMVVNVGAALQILPQKNQERFCIRCSAQSVAPPLIFFVLYCLSVPQPVIFNLIMPIFLSGVLCM